MIKAILGIPLLVAGVVGVLGLLFTLIAATSLWWAYWLHGLWEPIMVGIFGLPAITMWQFWALMMFLRSKQVGLTDFCEPTEEKKEEKSYIMAASWVISPPLTYYFISWALS